MGRNFLVARWLLAIGWLLRVLPPLFRWSRVPPASAQAVDDVTAPTDAEAVPGLAKVTVKSRFADGAGAEGAQCVVLGARKLRGQWAR